MEWEQGMWLWPHGAGWMQVGKGSSGTQRVMKELSCTVHIPESPDGSLEAFSRQSEGGAFQ